MRRTILDSLAAHAQSTPEVVAFRFLTDLNVTPDSLTYLELQQKVEAVASFLSQSVPPGSRILLLFPPGLSYIVGFFGCLMAGMVAVPLYPQRRNVKSNRIIEVAKDCTPALALTVQADLAAAQRAWDEQNDAGLELPFHAIEGVRHDGSGESMSRTAPGSDAVPAFLQYTSGSTGAPKGVVISHQNIMANVEHLSLMSDGSVDDVFVNWLPLFHDLGLVTAVLWPLYLGAPSTIMAPATFVRDPSIWLKAISIYRGTMCGGPNFAYDLCAKKVDLAADLDLSCWRVAYNAAEPVRAETMTRFSRHFAASGFSPQAFYPCYGMAEATVAISGGDASAAPKWLPVDQRALADNRVVVVDASDQHATAIVACGVAPAPHDLRIVDPASCRELGDGTVGEVWFAGPSVSSGYWNMAELNALTFGQRIAGNETEPGYLRTGDLGFVRDGELFLTGRIKDLIILRGTNYYPQDIEASAVDAHEAIRPGAVAAFSLTYGHHEALVVLAEVEREHFRRLDVEQVTDRIRRQIASDHQLHVDQIILVKPYKMPFTSSGKIQRREAKAMLLSGALEAIHAEPLARSTLHIAPRDQIERQLHGIWCAVLQREEVSVDDDFFAIGGDSIKAAEIAGEIYSQMGGLRLDASQLNELSTIELLAKRFVLLEARASSEKTRLQRGPENRSVIEL